MSEDFTMPLMAKAIAGLGGLIGGAAFIAIKLLPTPAGPEQIVI